MPNQDIEIRISELNKKFKCIVLHDEQKENKSTSFVYPKSTSLFKKKHHQNMNIQIRNLTNKEQLIRIKKSIYFHQNRQVKEILTYYKTLSTNFSDVHCNRYVSKIKEIIEMSKNKKSYESIVDDFVRILFQISGVDDGKSFFVNSQYKLHLHIGSNVIPSIPDIACKTNKDIIWMVEESKHINTSSYLNGDFQLICHMLAAFQYNYKKRKKRPKSVYGFKMKNTKCFFYKINIFNKYLFHMKDNDFMTCLVVYKYPKGGIDINPSAKNSYDNIKTVFNILYNMKQSVNNKFYN